MSLFVKTLAVVFVALAVVEPHSPVEISYVHMPTAITAVAAPKTFKP
jgi:hypothetical protein